MDKWMDNSARPPGADQGFAEALARAVTVGLINRLFGSEGGVRVLG